MVYAELSSPLRHAQHPLWSLEELAPGTPLYNAPFILHLDGRLELSRLQAALQRVLARHAALRAVFHPTIDGPVEEILPERAVDCPLEDLSALPGARSRRQARQRLLAMQNEPFDLARGPLYRFRLLRCAPGRHELVCIIHHLVLDGRSVAIFTDDLAGFYFGRDPAELPASYDEVAGREREALSDPAARAAHAAFWRGFLGPEPALCELPGDRPRPPATLALRARLQQLSLPSSLAGRLAALARQCGTSRFRLLLAALGALIHRTTGRDELVLGLPVAGRFVAETAAMAGMFAHVLPCALRFRSGQTCTELLANVGADVQRMLQHELGLDQIPVLLGAGRPERAARAGSGFPCVMNQLFDYGRVQHADEHLRIGMEFVMERAWTPFELALYAAAGEDGIDLAFEYSGEVFDPPTVLRFARRLEVLLAGIAADPEARVDDLPLLAASESHQLLVEWNDTAAGLARELSVPGLFALQVADRPDAVAVVSGDLAVSYGALAGRTARLAARLRALGTAPEEPVGLCFASCLDWVTAMLAVLAAGGCYVPLDPSYPAERLALMAEGAGMAKVLTRGELCRRLPRGSFRCLDLDTIEEESVAGHAGQEAGRAAPPGGAGGERLAYVLYTSGSTGRPKGIGIPHRAVVRLAMDPGWTALGPGRRITQVSNMGFDAAAFEVWGALLRGGTLVAIPREALLAPWRLAAELRRTPVDAMLLTTSLFCQLAREEAGLFATVGDLTVGGEALDPDAAQRLLEVDPPRRFFNVYGPTECATFATLYPVTLAAARRGRIPIGKPIAETQVVLCDRGLQPVGLDGAGELCLAGDGLARGYYGRADLTAERFVPSLLGGEAGGRLYRTGDLARWLPSGDLEFLGRFDGQIKLRGFRIELGEIEEVLREHPAVRAAVVVHQRQGSDGWLAAYVVPAGGKEHGLGLVPELRARLASRLPEHMLPAAYVALDALPLTPHGKLDRRALPAPVELERESDAGSRVAPRTGLESALADIWQEVLSVEAPGVHDDFFALGGHSLLASRVLSRVRGLFGVELSLRVLFEAPTLEGLAERVQAALRQGSGMPAPPPLCRQPREPERPVCLPLSFGQSGLWFLDAVSPGRPTYNIPAALRLRGRLDARALERSLDEITRRHESLRTRFRDSGGLDVSGEGPVQEVLPALPLPRPLPLVDLRALSDGARAAEACRLAEEEALRPFDLARLPLLRCTLLRLAEEEHLFLLTVHHIVFDGWSMEVFQRELSILYSALRDGGAAAAPSWGLRELEVQYGDFAAWQRSPAWEPLFAAQLAWWRDRLGHEPPVLELPTDRPRPARQAARSFRGGSRAVRLPADLAASLQALSRGRTTLAMTLLAAFQALLHRLSGQDRVLVGMPVAGRGARELEGLIGFFVNHLVLAGDFAGEPSFVACLERVREAALGAFAHQDLPFERLVEELRPERDLSRHPLTQIVFAWQGTPLASPELAGVAVTPFDAPIRTTRFDLELHLWEAGAEIEGFCVHDRDLFDDVTVQRLLGWFAGLLAAAAAAPEEAVGRLAWLGEAERHQLLVEEQGPASPYPRDATLLELFDGQVAQRPDAVALVGLDQSLSYGELAARARRLARCLRRLGVGMETAVGLCCDRTADWVVGMLGSLAAGGLYVPLDPAYPVERLERMAAGTGLAAVVTRGGLGDLSHRLLGGSLRQVELDALDDQEAQETEELAGVGCALQLAYVLHTSGSTGRPKGIGVPHRAISRLVLDTDYVSLAPGDRIAQVSNMGFDAATFEVWGALLNGGTLVEISRETLLSPWQVPGELRRLAIDTLFMTPALFLQMAREVPDAFATLRDLVLGGEAPDPAAVRRVLEHGAPRRLLNGYGPTEGTTFTTWHRATAASASRARLPLGRPIANTRVALCDRRLEPVPLGVVGEICIGGEGLARGYVGRGDLTAERFVPSPLETGGRLYRTGDLARRLPTGELEILGRLDHQVKIRGFRVEPGEIEATLREHPEVREAVVLLRRDVALDNAPGDARLVAYVVPKPATAGTGDGGLVAGLRALLRRRLPEHMVPAALVTLAALPLTANGKVDRAALPAPGEEPGEAGGTPAGLPDGGAPRDAIEESVAAVLAELLDLPQVGTGDDFFALGGHSLLAIRVASRLRDLLGVDLPLRAVFENPSAAELAAQARALLAGGGAAGPPLVPLPRAVGGGPLLPPSFAQQRLWFLDRLMPGSSFYNIPYAVRLAGPLEVAPLAAALDEIERRHEVLRTVLVTVEGEPAQRIGPAAGRGLSLIDLEGLPAPEAGEARRLQRQDADRPFDLAAGPLWRAALLRLAPAEHVLLLNHHHVVSDGWSVGVFNRELAALYDAFRQGRPSPLAPLALQYADFAVWQRQWLREEVLESQLRFWRDLVGPDPPTLPLPTDRPRPAVQAFQGALEPLSLPGDLRDRLWSLGRRQGATPAITLLAAFFALLSRVTGESRLLVGTVVAGRSRPELQGLLGFFVNSLVMVGDLTAGPSFAALVARTRQMAMGAYAHQDLPFEQLVEDLAPERDLSRNPLFQATFIFQSSPPLAPPALPGVVAELGELELHTTHFDLELHFWQTADGLSGGCVFDTELFDAVTIRRLLGQLANLLHDAAARPEAPCEELGLLGEAERHALLAEWNDTAASAATDAIDGDGLAELALGQAERSPDAIALAGGGMAWSYGETARRASELAARLHRLGVGPEVVVGVMAGRSPEQAMALLAVLQAGGVYLPLDPELPPRRLGWMLEDSAAKVVLATAELAVRLSGTIPEVPTLRLDGAASARRAALPAAPAPEECLAYLLYTSGSSGLPKGVGITRRSLRDLLAWLQRDHGLGPDDRASQVSSPGFDVSLAEILPPLVSGAELRFPSADDRRDPARLLAWLAEEGISVAFLPTPLAHAVLGRPFPAGLGLRLLMTAGEALHAVQRQLPFRLRNLYGPTEATVYAIAEDVAGGPAPPPIGRPRDDIHALVLSPRGGLLPVGTAGELCLAGPGLARGYLGRPDLTAERFLPHPFGGSGERLYRTGDRARSRGDGRLEFLGRLDGQVKVRGVRVEPGEIEAVLAAHPAVRQAAVVALWEEGAAEPRLVAYVAAAEPVPPFLETELRRHLEELLPACMVPSAFVRLDALPLTANGKVDRRALPAPDGALRPMEVPFAPAETAMESLVAGIMERVLSVSPIGIDDPFFHLGGSSLSMAQAAGLLEEALGRPVSLISLFRAPTVRSLARLLSGGEDGLRRAEAAAVHGFERQAVERLHQQGHRRQQRQERQERWMRSLPPPETAELPSLRGMHPLSFAQKRLWFLDRLLPGNAFYNICYAVRLCGPLAPRDVAALAAALDEIERRHEVLRTTFAVVDGDPVQVIGRASGRGLPLVDLAGLGAAAGAAEARRLEQREAARPFSLTAGPLWRAALLRLDAGEHVLLLGQHHIISDGWSIGILHRELAALYAAFRRGAPSPLLEPRLQYADFAVWQRRWLEGPELAVQLAFWRGLLGTEPPALPLPADRPRPAVQTFRGAAQPLRLSPELGERLRHLGRRHGASPAITLLAGFFALLSRLTGESRLVVGSAVTGRTWPELEALPGFFVNSLPLVGDLAGETSFRGLVERTRAMTLAAYAHQDLPFELLVEELAPERDLSRNPLFQTVFSLQASPMAAPELPGLATEMLGFHVRTTHFDLELHLWDEGAGFMGGCVYDRDLFDATTIQRLLVHFLALLEAAATSPEERLDRLPLLVEAERHRLLAEWNDTGAGQTEPGVEELIAGQSARRPDAVALVAGDVQWSYGELAARSARLAVRLRHAGVGPETVVGVLTGRCPELAVACLAILRAGGAYLPLDPELPPARLDWLLRDAGAVAVVTTAALGSWHPVALGQAKTLLIEDAAPDDSAGLDSAKSPGSDGLAYVLYTSGSTGAPKGVAVSRAALSNLVHWHLETYGLGPADRASQVASVGFDASVWELFPPLAAGASLYMPEEAVRRDPVRLGDWLVEQGITIAFLPTPLVHALDERDLPRGLALRALLTGGEALHPLRRELPCALLNHYGPTENTVVATREPVLAGSPGAPAIGRPIAGVRVLVADGPSGEPVLPGAAGELWLAGAGLARGYLGRPDLTAARFVPDPFGGFSGGGAGARAYRTGDRVRSLADGRLEFLGRGDQQVKVRGFRIEPGEIEAALLGHAAVRETVVVARSDGGGEPRLVAYVVAGENGDGGPPAAELRRHLDGLLPAYMVPAVFVRLDALPLTPHGKVDRRALPPPAESARPADVPFAAPRSNVEWTVARVWRQVLGVESLGIDDPFFDLGGSSLSMARAASLLETALSRPVPLVWMFRFPTVRTLAEALDSGNGEARPPGTESYARAEQSRQRLQTQDRRRQQRREHRF